VLSNTQYHSNISRFLSFGRSPVFSLGPGCTSTPISSQPQGGGDAHVLQFFSFFPLMIRKRVHRIRSILLRWPVSVFFPEPCYGCAHHDSSDRSTRSLTPVRFFPIFLSERKRDFCYGLIPAKIRTCWIFLAASFQQPPPSPYFIGRGSALLRFADPLSGTRSLEPVLVTLPIRSLGGPTIRKALGFPAPGLKFFRSSPPTKRPTSPPIFFFFPPSRFQSRPASPPFAGVFCILSYRTIFLPWTTSFFLLYACLCSATSPR